jgi:tRNA threonylcarbamoyladenosine biosynthesis protein TsaB
LLTLGIHTAGAACDVALADGESGRVATQTEAMANGHDGRLPGMVEDLLRNADVRMSDLDRIAVVVGPGSFTGVRVGVAFARGLALAIGRPCFGATTLEAMEPTYGAIPPGRVLALAPAKLRPPDLSWWAQILQDGEGVEDPLELDAAGVERLSAQATAICGSGPPEMTFGGVVQAAQTSAAAAARFVASRPAESQRRPDPVYVREPDALPMRRP